MGGELPPSASVATRMPRRRRPLILTCLLLPTTALSFSIKIPSSSLQRPTGYRYRGATTDNGPACPSKQSPSQAPSFSKSKVVLYSSPLARLNLPNPLALGRDSPDSSDSQNSLFAKAKAFLSSDLGINDDGAAISEDFIWIGANLGGGKVLNKKDYLAAGKFFDLRSTFPDLDYRAHDFRIDEDDPNTVRLTARTVGTMRGELRLRTETLPPNGKRMVCPPEAISVTFDPTTGLVTKLCSGFCLDRLVGNTRGLCGVRAAAVVAGAPPSEWETYPPTTVVSRFFGRTVKQLPDDPGAFLAPFPETVMVQLAKGVIAADNGAADPELLSPSFTFCGPFVGPIDRDGFVKAFGGFKLKEAFPDLDPSYTNFRVDPYDPYRVWVDARASGTRTGSLAGSQPTGLRYEGPPEAASFTFDDDGFCTRLTGGYVLDPSVGNTGGLGGVYGIFYATGTPLPGISSRPLPELLTRLQKRILEPITGVGVDEYKLPKTLLGDVMGGEGSGTTTPSVRPSPPIKPPSIPVPPSIKGSVEPPKVKPPPPMKTKTIAPPPKPAAVSQSVTQRKDVNLDLGDPVTDAFKSLFGAEEKRGAGKATAPPPPPAAKATASGKDLRKKQLEEKRKQQAEAAKRAAEVTAEAKRKRDEEQRAAAEAKREQQRMEAERKKAAAESQRVAAEAKRVQQRVEAERRKAAAEAQRVETERKRVAAEEQRVAEEARREAQRQEAERKKAAAEEQRAAAEAKLEDQRKAAEERKKEAAEKQRAAAEAKRVAQRQDAERRKAAAEERRVAAERQRQEAQRKKEAAEEARKQAIAQRAKAEQAARDAKAKRAAEAKAAAEKVKKLKDDIAAKKAAAEAAKKVKAAKPGATINLFDAFGKSSPEPATSRPSTPGTRKSLSRKEAAAAAEKVMKDAKPGATINLFGAFGQSASGDEPLTTKPKPKVTPKKEAAAAAENAVKRARPGATISLFSAFLKSPEGEKSDVAETKGTMFASKKPALRGPKGVPVLTKWRKMRDGSVTGNIFGSSSFEEGEQVTTSAIVRGEFAAGNVVQTQSGSRYFLGEQ